jgi:hypothetical protein
MNTPTQKPRGLNKKTLFIISLFAFVLALPATLSNTGFPFLLAEFVVVVMVLLLFGHIIYRLIIGKLLINKKK